MYIPNVSVKVDITSLVGVRLGVRGGGAETVNFDVKAKLEEKERKSQFVVVGFNLLVATKPSVVKFEVEGTATLTGKDAEISKMLEVDPEIKVPYVFQRVYQFAFTAMYLVSTVLNAPPPPQNLLFPQKEGVPVGEISVDVEAAPKETVSVQAAPPPSEESSEEKSEVSVSNQ
ncbi:hypothetical protein HXY33_08020 [Candidatus Bathyarchaeota archaeon]|nr:hypothetical protein [Candidatus Bathyarchaeota archaeon]